MRTKRTGRIKWRRRRRSATIRRARRKDTTWTAGVSVCTRQRMSSQIKDGQIYPNPQSSYLYCKVTSGLSFWDQRTFKWSGNIRCRVNWIFWRNYEKVRHPLKYNPWEKNGSIFNDHLGCRFHRNQSQPQPLDLQVQDGIDGIISVGKGDRRCFHLCTVSDSAPGRLPVRSHASLPSSCQWPG